MRGGNPYALETAKQDGCDVIIGGYSVQQDASLLGLPPSCCARAETAQSLEEAIRTVTPRPTGAHPDESL